MATILLADDSLTTQKVVNLTFADEGIEVITADDGDMALQLFRERQPDIVLADVNMPGLNGYEVCEAIRKTNDSATTPVVLLVGSFEPFDAETAHRVGANDYLTKPFSSIRRLVATVLAFLDEQTGTEQAVEIDEVEEITVEPTVAEAEPVLTEEAQFGQVFETEEPANAEIYSPEVETKPEPIGPQLLAEPDMRGTNDIEDLYTQSFAETVEMPHTIAERARFSDVSGDDELIETTYSERPQQVMPPQPEEQRITEEILQPLAQMPPVAPFAEPESVSEPQQVSYETTKLPAPASEQFGFTGGAMSSVESAVDSGVYDQAEAPQEIRPQDAPTEEYNFEYRSEEAYFEPPPESPVETQNTEAPEPVEPSEAVGASDELSETPAAELTEIHQMEEPADMPAAAPWETVAPPSHSFTFDESNLLELPTDTSSVAPKEPGRAAVEPSGNEPFSTAMVERIAHIVASQMSEQLIREIAERVVPMVVEETLARRNHEEGNN